MLQDMLQEQPGDAAATSPFKKSHSSIQALITPGSVQPLSFMSCCNALPVEPLSCQAQGIAQRCRNACRNPGGKASLTARDSPRQTPRRVWAAGSDAAT